MLAATTKTETWETKDVKEGAKGVFASFICFSCDFSGLIRRAQVKPKSAQVQSSALKFHFPRSCSWGGLEWPLGCKNTCTKPSLHLKTFPEQKGK